MEPQARQVYVHDVDHLVTYTVGRNHGVEAAEDGLKKLRTMQDRTGLWTLRSQLIVEDDSLIIIDKQTGEEMERYHWSEISEPTAVVSKDREELFNNLVIFTVGQNRVRPTTEMHIFHVLSGPSREVVEDIKVAQLGRLTGGYASARRANSQPIERVYSAPAPTPLQPPPTTVYREASQYAPDTHPFDRPFTRYQEHDTLRSAPDYPQYIPRLTRY